MQLHQKKQCGSVTHNRSLVISSFKEEDQGLYWCEKCYQDSCNTEQSTVIRVKKEILEEIQQTMYVTEGSSFEYECLVHQSGDSSVSCDVICDLEFSRIKSYLKSNEGTGTTTISVGVDPKGSLNCSPKQIHDVYSKVNGTHKPSNASNKTTGTESKYLTPVIFGTLAALVCFILMALLVFYFRKRLRAVFPDHPSCCGIDDRLKEENSVVYSSVIIGRTAKTSNNHIDCVYSEINV
ncbi:hypothetical protein F2P81_002468 [Scophthalmus maximus]|uniref:Uncharacterized protein n=1 Tax=Scophthalmus maximus TaxID=52904 RepID=A0A6A4TM73_SCOMX|nr:hypothetical protein F2P81_002468 [Scophthalmus maximus]